MTSSDSQPGGAAAPKMRAMPLEGGSSGGVARLHVAAAAAQRRLGAAALAAVVALVLLARGRPREATPISAAPLRGASCARRQARDCGGRCFPSEWLGDGWCDAPTDGIDLNCSARGWDGGDCLAANAACPPHHARDCRGHCAPAAWRGDGACDSPRQGFELNCSALGFDGGDCLRGADGCAPGFVPLCAGVRSTSGCVPAAWVGDGACDAVLNAADGAPLGSLNCSGTDFDGGDCLPDADGCLGHRVRGCTGSCVDGARVGDGFCDDCTDAMVTDGYCEPSEVARRGPLPRFNCSALGFDGGDCLRDADGCYGGHRADCRGRCVPAHYVGDGQCDAPRQDFWLNCSALEWDGGDCLRNAG